MMEYIVLKTGSIEKLIKLVNDFIQDGWKPCGGVSGSQSLGTTSNA